MLVQCQKIALTSEACRSSILSLVIGIGEQPILPEGEYLHTMGCPGKARTMRNLPKVAKKEVWVSE